MSEIYLNAPIQNTPFNPDDRVGKVVPILVADWLRQENNSSLPVIDLWNSTGASYETKEAARLGLENKYASRVLSSLTTDGPRLVESDIDDAFNQWTNTVVESLLSKGALEADLREVYACGSCGNAISLLDSAPPLGCGACLAEDVVIVNKRVLVSHINEEALHKTSIATHGSFDARSYPTHGTILNKQRVMGVELDQFGFEGEVLDPKVTVGMLALYVAQRYDADRVGLVASRSSAAHNLPQLFGFLGPVADELPQISMKQIAKAPVGYIDYLLQEGIISEEAYHNALSTLLPPHLLRMKKDMTPQTAEHIIFARKNI